MDKNKTAAQKNIERDRKLRKNLDRVSDAVGMRTDKGMDTYAIVLAAICLIFAVVFFVSGSVGVGFIFVGVALLLAALVAVPKIIAAIKNRK